MIVEKSNLERSLATFSGPANQVLIESNKADKANRKIVLNDFEIVIQF